MDQESTSQIKSVAANSTLIGYVSILNLVTTVGEASFGEPSLAEKLFTLS